MVRAVFAITPFQSARFGEQALIAQRDFMPIDFADHALARDGAELGYRL